MQGGVAQGIGWALNEEYVYDADGRLENPGFLDYRVPVCSDLPMIDTILIEVPNPRHPFGARAAAAGSANVAAEDARRARRARPAADGCGISRSLPVVPASVHAAILGCGSITNCAPRVPPQPGSGKHVSRSGSSSASTSPALRAEDRVLPVAAG
jgi:hypothetical protein